MAESDPRIIRASGQSLRGARLGAEPPQSTHEEDHAWPVEEPVADQAPADLRGSDAGMDPADRLVIEARERIVGLRPAEALGRDAGAPRLAPDIRAERPLEGDERSEIRGAAPRGRSRTGLFAAAALIILALGAAAAWFFGFGVDGPSQPPPLATAPPTSEAPQQPLVASGTPAPAPLDEASRTPVRRVDEPPAAGTVDPVGGAPAAPLGAAPEPMLPERVRTYAVGPDGTSAAAPEAAPALAPPAAPPAQTPLVPVRVRTTAIDGTGLPPAVEPEPLGAPAPQTPVAASEPVQAAPPATPEAVAAEPSGAAGASASPPRDARLPRPRPIF